jgi:tripartite-type tricarboxylate transporter receptor subunit TctC
MTGRFMLVAWRLFVRFAAAAAVSCALAQGASAQGYPSRPLRWIVPYPAGGTTDLIARLMGQWLAEHLGQPVIIENKPGGGTNIGVHAVVNAPADGSTLLFAVATNAINQSLYKSLPFNFQRDIAPVAGLAELPLVMEVNPKLPAASVAEFVAFAKAHPGEIRIASFGARTISHLAIELFKSAAGIDVLHVPYAGGSALITDLLTGRIEAAVDALPNSLPHIRDGGARALAIFPLARTPVLPDVPTMNESIAGLEVSTWSGVGVPSATPADVIERLNREINAGLADAALRSRFAEVGAVPLQLTADEFRARITRDVEKWAKVINLAGIEPY